MTQQFLTPEKTEQIASAVEAELEGAMVIGVEAYYMDDGTGIAFAEYNFHGTIRIAEVDENLTVSL